MKTQVSSFSLAANNEISLGWNSMPGFPAATHESELGWSAMSAFGATASTHGHAEEVADFAMEARSMRQPVNTNLLTTFWNMLSSR